MDIDENQPQILANRRGVTFSLVLPNGKVTCVIALRALETYFWLEPRASDTDVLGTFENGFVWIRAIAERKFRARPATHLKSAAEASHGLDCSRRYNGVLSSQRSGAGADSMTASRVAPERCP
ncbi:DUF1488 family protein [Paraburkholderia azotifigens]|uniref:DUF1488 domain-containing protein n=1 Tax=Paraburkholderia azotifigens TaxID=2057004 RepID=A0A5C6V3B0_9BURK|nr:DUF1488 domain-containing protein [Paraburkholderia azotifigens]